MSATELVVKHLFGRRVVSWKEPGPCHANLFLRKPLEPSSPALRKEARRHDKRRTTNPTFFSPECCSAKNSRGLGPRARAAFRCPPEGTISRGAKNNRCAAEVCTEVHISFTMYTNQRMLFNAFLVLLLLYIICFLLKQRNQHHFLLIYVSRVL